MRKLSERNEQARWEIEKPQDELEENGRNILQESQNEADLKLEIWRSVNCEQGKGRSGSNASQSAQATPRNEATDGSHRKAGENHQASLAAGLDPLELKKSLWFTECMFIEAPEEGTSTCPSTGPEGELLRERMITSLLAEVCGEKIKNMTVVEDFESRPHKVVAFFL